MVSKEKMSKRKRNELNAQSRNFWTMSPVTRIKESGKRYNRQAVKQACRT